mmetsp:Transcript_46999/g.152545  ORF Transcript_46999/g.152545 Transcript_46999/m.152545 type:complete len:201 (+) Transcript_46999:573-1175(+)
MADGVRWGGRGTVNPRQRHWRQLRCHVRRAGYGVHDGSHSHAESVVRRSSLQRCGPVVLFNLCRKLEAQPFPYLRWHLLLQLRIRWARYGFLRRLRSLILSSVPMHDKPTAAALLSPTAPTAATAATAPTAAPTAATAACASVAAAPAAMPARQRLRHLLVLDHRRRLVCHLAQFPERLPPLRGLHHLQSATGRAGRDRL